jgi:hypothetical protein
VMNNANERVIHEHRRTTIPSARWLRKRRPCRASR